MQFDFSPTRLTLVDYAAGFAVRRMLRYYLRRPTRPFVAVLQSPDEEDIRFYEDAVGRLLKVMTKEHESADEVSSLAAEEEAERVGLVSFAQISGGDDGAEA